MEEMQEEIKQLKHRIKELEKAVGILDRTHRYDIARVFSEIDKLGGVINE